MEYAGKELHFVFPDRLLAYDCVACGAKCCRGYNTTLDGAVELVPLLVHKPELAPFVFRAPGFTDEYAMFTFNPACALLDADSMCVVEAELGRSVKPVTCRLFPVDRISTIGDHVFVDVNFLCPLGLRVDGGDTATIVDHAAVRRDLAEVRATDVFTRRELVQGDLEDHAEHLVTIERALRDEVSAAFDDGALHACQERFCAWLREYAVSHAGEVVPGPVLDERRVAGTASALDRFYGTRLVPLPADADLRLRRNLLAVLCSAHHKYLIRRPIASLSQLLRESHSIVCAMIGIEFMYRGIVQLSPRLNTIDTLTDIVGRSAPVALIQSNILRRPRLRPLQGTRLDVPHGFKQTVTRFVRALRTPAGPPALADVLESLELPQSERGTFMRWLSATDGVLFEFSDDD